MFPSAPLPDFSSLRRQLHQVIGPYLAIYLGARPSALDLSGYAIRQFRRAQQQHIAVLQQPCVVMMIRLAQLQENSAVPVRLQRHAAFERRPPQKSIVGNFSVVEASTALGEVSVE